MEDYLVRGMTEGGNVIGLACVTTNLVEDARRRHKTCPTATAALGRALTGGGLLGALLDEGQRVAIKFTGDGPLKKIVVEAEGDGTVRGYVQVPRVDLPPVDGKLDVGGAIGRRGFLTVTRDLRIRAPYSGIVELHTGEIASDIAYYLSESEQVPSAVGLGVYVEADERVGASGGFLVQSLPPRDDALISSIERTIQSLPGVTTLLMQGKTPEDILGMIFTQTPFRIIETRRVSFACSCSVGRIEQALVTLGKRQIEEIAATEEMFDIFCHFCNKTYVFTREHLLRLAREMH
ncbi:MAG TPA: Hsp33 family molecular chaperone HslO [Deltaproteobacteria bacterium]|nr:Hsp33 family molecular chaperone HslO [Deltaproteobacteria bacterium]HOM28328.1 Hsp33 family molecular chaperone HslO [Deltaproteobacteria bacterium]HPP79331.1 Hsp33 family molecular chaperone HslO [Deltaproteobacteria bacterium]